MKADSGRDEFDRLADVIRTQKDQLRRRRDEDQPDGGDGERRRPVRAPDALAWKRTESADRNA